MLANDTATDAAIDPSSLTVVSAPDLGAATVSGDGVEFTASDQAGTATLTYAVCDVTQRCSVAEVTITITDDDAPPVPCEVMVIDSFQAAPWTFTFQIRNSSNQPVDFEFLIPNANYELTNLQFNGSGQNLVLTQASNGDGTFDITVSGSVPAYQSVGGQQPNGFNGQLTPAQEAPIVTCQ